MSLSSREKKKIYHFFWIFLMSVFIISGFLLLVSSTVDYPYSGIISNIECDICEDEFCSQRIYINVSYEVNNSNLIGIYETESFPSCELELIYYWEEQCCTNLIETEVYFKLSEKNSNLITKLSLNDKDKNTVQYIFSVILFCLGAISCLLCAFLFSYWEEKCINRHNYVNISN